MTTRQRLALVLPLILLLLASIACQAVAQAWQPRLPAFTPPPSLTYTPPPTYTPLLPTPTLTATPSPVPPTSTASSTPTATILPTVSQSQLQIFLDVFEQLWETVKDHYLYTDYNGLDWEAIHVEYLQRIQAGISEEEFYAAMQEMIRRLGDDHSTFLSPDEVLAEHSELAGDYNYVGIGVITEPVPERRRVTIILVFPGSPAEQAGLQIHDSILKVDGIDILDQNGFRNSLLRGPEGSRLVLTVQTPGEEPRQVTLTRHRITSKLPVPYHVFSGPGGKRIGYMLLTTFYDVNVPAQVKEALRAMAADGPLDGLILDNRQNTGGINTVFSDTLSYFTNGTMGYFINRQERAPLRIRGQGVNNSQKIPLVVLVGKGTVSFGEIFSGILKDIGRAYLIGETTDGNVEILYTYDFKDGSEAWIAHDTFRPLKHPDQNWEETGIIPDLTVLSNWDEITLESDPVVQAAVEHFDEN